MEIHTDILVMGSGISGLSFSLKVADKYNVTLVTKGPRDESATNYAQGGIASVLDADKDSFDLHIRDTLEAGAGLCNEDVVRQVVQDGPERIKELVDFGVPFTLVDDHSGLHLTREGGHSVRRIVHADDLTGREIINALLARADQHPKIQIVENQLAVNLLTRKKLDPRNQEDRVLGAYVFDKSSGEVLTYLARVVVIATGGSGKVYLITTNPDGATGDGLAMAYRAGAAVGDLEFVQFHPTCLYHPLSKNFLISEAVRGEGGVLVNKAGIPFMEKYHPLKSLAARDIVARVIDHEIKTSGHECVYLDVTHLGPDRIRTRFPNIYNRLLSLGIDMTKEPIPVAPAAHYQCGGVFADLDGQTSLPGLLAIGEVACTGLHGANRLASNSLLEALVMAHRAALLLLKNEPPPVAGEKIRPWDPGKAAESDETIVVTHNWEEIRRTMANYVGIVRTNKRLMRAMNRVDLLQKEIDEYYWNFKITPDLVELRNIAEVASLIVRCASLRKESRGLHYNLDYPSADESLRKDSVLIR